MNTLISAVRIRDDRAEILRSKIMEIFKKSGELYKESDIVNFLIDNYAEKIVVNNEGKLTLKE